MSKTILIVDDSASIRQVVTLTLEEAGHEVVSAEDGVDGLSKLDGRKIHLIVSDVNMPNMDGLTFVAKAKEIEEYKFTPVLMLTTESSPELKAKGKEAGAKAWLVKPFKPELLLGAINKLT